ncbi:alpha/beta hydrolase [Hoeflea sp. 108]|uniref:alpha/beta fold hydrolase n=1 Tax=Hoeflea sp. 108 TaxID=1116369 RepID=UPI0012F7E544|nr:alpha/beta hydrolase [Hoeflea sp. 108]
MSATSCTSDASQVTPAMPNATIQTSFVGASPRIAVESVGEGELVVFMHGIGGNRRNWRDNLPVFGEHFCAVAWDARGYGDSDDYETELRFRDFADDLARVLDHFGEERAHIIGLSMGGRIAMDFAYAYPDRLRTITLCATNTGFSRFSPEARAEFIRSRREPLMNGKEPVDIAGPVAQSLMGPKASAAALAQLVDSMSRLHKHSYIKSIEALVNLDTHVSLDHIAVPAHVMCGSDDPLTPLSMSREITQLIPQATLTVVPDAGHLLNIENPVDFNAAALNFLLRHQQE